MSDESPNRLIQISEARLAEMMGEQAQLGAKSALAEIGVRDEADVEHLRKSIEFGRTWKKVTDTVTVTIVRTITVGILALLALGLGMKIKG